MSDKEYPICHRCDLCDFQTREMNEFKKHIISKNIIPLKQKNLGILWLILCTLEEEEIILNRLFWSLFQLKNVIIFIEG